MLKSLRLGVAAVMLALLALALATVTAQENTNGNALPSGAIPTGTYERFTMLQKIRFGATALVNPSLAESAAVVYSFEPDEVLSTAVWHQEVTDQMSAGRVQFGQVVEAGTKTVLKVDRDTAKIREQCEIQADVKSRVPSTQSWWRPGGGCLVTLPGTAAADRPRPRTTSKPPQSPDRPDP